MFLGAPPDYALVAEWMHVTLFGDNLTHEKRRAYFCSHYFFAPVAFFFFSRVFVILNPKRTGTLWL